MHHRQWNKHNKVSGMFTSVNRTANDVWDQSIKSKRLSTARHFEDWLIHTKPGFLFKKNTLTNQHEKTNTLVIELGNKKKTFYRVGNCNHNSLTVCMTSSIEFLSFSLIRHFESAERPLRTRPRTGGSGSCCWKTWRLRMRLQLRIQTDYRWNSICK
jgi:hypothetical protein